MKNRLGKLGRHSAQALCLLTVCGLMYACKDEFVLDDEKPSWLSSSIYEYLEQRGNYRTYLKLLADKDVNPENERSLVDVLQRTGSRTVFVANDSAWDAFFAGNAKLPEANPWHRATSYDNLSPSQKNLLIHTSMLNNAIVMENLASSESSGTNTPTRGEFMRRETVVEAIDSITELAGEDIPKFYTSGEKDYWEKFRNTGVLLATDSTPPMMLHFTAEHMTRNNITDDDFYRIMGRKRNTSDVHIYDALLLKKDGVCENGYVNVTEKPLCPIPNMAEVLRTNGKTKIFSHILERFSAPYYSARLTDAYSRTDANKRRNPKISGAVYTKRYFSSNNIDVKAGYIRKSESQDEVPVYEPASEDGKFIKWDPYTDAGRSGEAKPLKFDPGWNGYYGEVDARKDMAAMFAPNDDALYKYFFDGGTGTDFITIYYQKKGTADEIPYVKPAKDDFEEIFRQLDCIPIGVLSALVNNHLQITFTGSVPSKWKTRTDDAQEPLFDDADFTMKNDHDTTLIANNGVIYVMRTVCVPADYRCVTSPAYISHESPGGTKFKLIYSAIYGDFMQLNYYAYLKAMQSRFTLLLPDDDALLHYYDPASMKSKTPRLIQFTEAKGTPPVKLTCYVYNGPYSGENESEWGPTKRKVSDTPSPSEITNRLKDILESHTIVHDGTNPLAHSDDNNKVPTQEYYGISTSTPLQEYYLSKNGNAIKVVRDPDDDNRILAVKGGFQLENERLQKEHPGFLDDGNDYETKEGYAGTKGTDDRRGLFRCNVTETKKTDNGYSLIINAPLVPTYRSVYSIFTNDADQNNGIADETTPYSNFYKLCPGSESSKYIIGCGLVDEKIYKPKTTQQTSALKKFQVFVEDNGLDLNVQFFNNYRYTVFVPTNEAIERAIANGLPTWEDIEADFLSHCKPERDSETGEIVRDEETGEIVYTDSLRTSADSLRIQAKITYLTNFIRYHFADNSVFADKTELSPNEMVTSSYDRDKELFCKIHVDRVFNGIGTDLRVCDDVSWKKNGNSMEGSVQPFVTVEKIDGKDVQNILARDISCSKKPVNVSMRTITISSSSAAVIHSINGCLNHTTLVDGRHDKTWETTAKARAYLKRYAIR